MSMRKPVFIGRKEELSELHRQFKKIIASQDDKIAKHVHTVQIDFS